MSEHAIWVLMRDRLKPWGHWVRVENRVGPGTPDVNFCLGGREGWIELKELPSFPLSGARIVRLRHDLMPDQRRWLQKRARNGGNAYVLMRVARPREYFLWDGDWAAENLGKVVQSELRGAAIWSCGADFEHMDLLDILAGEV